MQRRPLVQAAVSQGAHPIILAAACLVWPRLVTRIEAAPSNRSQPPRPTNRPTLTKKLLRKPKIRSAATLGWSLANARLFSHREWLGTHLFPLRKLHTASTATIASHRRPHRPVRPARNSKKEAQQGTGRQRLIGASLPRWLADQITYLPPHVAQPAPLSDPRGLVPPEHADTPDPTLRVPPSPILLSCRRSSASVFCGRSIVSPIPSP